ncbi:coproporphyrinogen-III oxidase family protein [Entomospira culicis]|uniref:Coproporphyrinogen III oxidase family protein n=1 Tax=Entomospira culicis TaxID=2719989 RepID=A0A968KW42_9SPIO|nr:coproporphyrinogen-III oxidase family protein [Entomospira culicis]NIZ19262.1 coproporphyrinogen III oxidase family protein [Entomospira culicis]NIZ69833.1 coproporphyrinogen III oxidase family protein [Entomospira culicis]WDI36939.1 coproporphyrinogen-III oxidase family protein [Entomospira culicis]WDI38568.1 coproporphyrinogen-III oxidase family protein [Entomospira culicis]
MIMDEIALDKIDRREPFALYVHLPFCHYRCHYCDFYASAGVDPQLRRKVIARILREITNQLAYLHMERLVSVYVGGGTPSMIDGDQLSALIDLVQSYHPQQVTIEVNPEDVSKDLIDALGLARWQNLRVSMGMQTFHQASLDAVGRKVTTQQMFDALELLSPYKARLSLDLIAGLPFHTQAIVESDMHRLVTYRPAHLSLYALAMEEGTVLTYRHHPHLPNEEERSIQWQASQRMLLASGYQQYEVSNYALTPNDYSLQNTHYWQLKPYIGIGPGAVGTLPLLDGSALRITGRREFGVWSNPDDINLWHRDMIERESFIFEHYMMGFRTALGISKAILKERFGDAGLAPWEHLQKSKWREFLQEDDRYITLTEQGRLVLDAILLDLL